MDIKKGVQQVIQTLYDKHGEVRPTFLIKAAKSPNSPAHNAFEWDDTYAGQEYRLMQARQWIRRVEITFEDRTERLVHIPVFTEEDDGKFTMSEGYYKPIHLVARDNDEFEKSLDQLKGTLNSARKSYEELKKAVKQPDVKKINIKQADRGFNLLETAIGT